MHDYSDPTASKNYLLRPGYIYLALAPTIISSVLGSSVSVSIFDNKMKIGCMNHFNMPVSSAKDNSTALFGNIATSHIIHMMKSNGSLIKNLTAQIYGGAFNSSVSSYDIGVDNINIAKKILLNNKISILSEDIGGSLGRKVIFNTTNNESAILKVDTLRLEDWYPYLSER